MAIVCKSFKKKIKCYGIFRYKSGETYEINGELNYYENGFNYCKSIADADWYYDLRYGRVCEVEILGSEVSNNYGNFATDKIRIVKELSKEEINQYFEDNWEELINDENYRSRISVVRRGFGLDTLIKDKDWEVRKEVARHGRDKDLDVLVFDKSEMVRWIVACHGRPQDLDILVKDRDWQVRRAVAAHGRPNDLDILVRDSNEIIRVDIARQGRPCDLDILVKDENDMVKREVWKHGRACDLKILKRDKNKKKL